MCSRVARLRLPHSSLRGWYADALGIFTFANAQAAKGFCMPKETASSPRSHARLKNLVDFAYLHLVLPAAIYTWPALKAYNVFHDTVGAPDLNRSWRTRFSVSS